MATPCTSIRFTEDDKAMMNIAKEKFGVKNVAALVRLGFRILIALSETQDGQDIVSRVQKEMG